MGAQFSASVVNQKEMTKIVNDSIIENIQSCVQSFNAEQVLTVNGNNNVIENVGFNQMSDGDRDCISRPDNSVKFDTAMKAKLAALAETKTKNDLPFYIGYQIGVSFVNQQSVTDILNKSLTRNLQECDVSTNLKQQMNINGDYNELHEIFYNQEKDGYSRCIFDPSNMTAMQTKVEKDMNAQAKAQTAAGMSGLLTIIIIVLGVAAAIFALVKLLSSRKQLNQSQIAQQRARMAQLQKMAKAAMGAPSKPTPIATKA